MTLSWVGSRVLAPGTVQSSCAWKLTVQKGKHVKKRKFQNLPRRRKWCRVCHNYKHQEMGKYIKLFFFFFGLWTIGSTGQWGWWGHSRTRLMCPWDFVAKDLEGVSRIWALSNRLENLWCSQCVEGGLHTNCPSSSVSPLEVSVITHGTTKATWAGVAGNNSIPEQRTGKGFLSRQDTGHCDGRTPTGGVRWPHSAALPTDPPVCLMFQALSLVGYPFWSCVRVMPIP